MKIKCGQFLMNFSFGKVSKKMTALLFIEIIKNPSLNSGFLLSISDYSASSAILSISAKLVVASSAVITNSSAIAASSSSDNFNHNIVYNTFFCDDLGDTQNQYQQGLNDLRLRSLSSHVIHHVYPPLQLQ